LDKSDESRDQRLSEKRLRKKLFGDLSAIVFRSAGTDNTATAVWFVEIASLWQREEHSFLFVVHLFIWFHII
jgi:hypothetical protein